MAAPDIAELSWVYNPWRADWRRPALALTIITAVAALAGFSFTYPAWWPGMLGWSAISLCLLCGMTMMIFVPVRYRLDARGVTVYFFGVANFRPWEHYRNYYVHKTGVHLTTMPQPSALDPFRGHYLQFSGNRDEVSTLLAAHIQRPVQHA